MLSAADFIGPWSRGRFNEIKDLDWDIAPLPKKKLATSPIYIGGMAIFAGTKHPEEAWRFVKYLTSREAQQIWRGTDSLAPPGFL
ncbi:MAG TPA: extracellular solute-binding protein [Firmicutes bacterium]|nr:extracellular solute-binding protein [Bacillota bacterium]